MDDHKTRTEVATEASTAEMTTAPCFAATMVGTDAGAQSVATAATNDAAAARHKKINTTAKRPCARSPRGAAEAKR